MERTSGKSPLRLLLWTALAGLIFGLIGFGEIAEDALRIGRNKLHTHPASGDIVLVAIDDRSLREFGAWPWPRQRYAELTDRISAAGANRIFFDVTFESRSNRKDDAQFAEAITRSGRVTLPVRGRTGARQREKSEGFPLEMFSRATDLGSINVDYNYQNAVWQLPYARQHQDRLVPSFAASLAFREELTDERFTIDYSIDPTTILTVPAADILAGRFSPAALHGKDIVVGGTSKTIGDEYFIPGVGKMGGAFVHILGAETLKAGTPVSVGWVPPLVAALVASLVALLNTHVRPNRILGAAALLLLIVPVLLEAHLIFVDITPALFVVGTIAAVLNWSRWRQSGLINSVSGLPNLNALQSNRAGRKQALIAARVLNHAEIVASLPPDSERQLTDQIVARLKVGAPDRTLYQGDGGIFAWFEDSQLPFGNHIDALHALFRTPARVAGQQIDLSICFGVEIGSGRSLANRLGSALVAADEAAHDGLKWKCHDPDTLQNASWKLSMLSQLDEAVDKGEIWVAYQPKLDLASNEIVSAEALARWTHPEKGPIAASEFIAAAEQHDRIGKLTDFVLERAVSAAAMFNQKRPGFGIAVNLSARLLTDKGFTLRLAAMLARHGLPPQRLTLELTETATLADSGSAADMLAAIRELGVTISIDDYGTGLSTLEYLKKVPASEIKIDQSFVKGMLDNRSDRLMVQSTIALAHSLDRRVVAEGVESRELLDALIEMECDVAQGFIIGRPMSLESILKRIGAARRRNVA